MTSRLRVAHGSPRHNNKEDPVDELVFIILSQMTTAPSFNRVFDRLKSSVRSWDELLEMPLHKMKALIRDAGLSRQKAPRIRSILHRLKDDFGRITLEPLRRMSNREAEQYLTSLPGVGTKTSKCVLMYSLGRHVLPVDTHVARVARRLGLLRRDVPAPEVHDVLEAVVRPADRYAFHVNAVAHGQALCLASHPRCQRCPLVRVCEYPGRVAAQPRLRRRPVAQVTGPIPRDLTSPP